MTLLKKSDILEGNGEYTDAEIKKLKLFRDDIELRGKYIACKYCKKQFKILDPNKRIIWWDKGHQVCPFCKQSWCTKPKHEKLLFDLQDQYIAGGRKPEDLSEIAIQMYPYVQSLILKHYNYVITSVFHLNEIKSDVVTVFLEDYLRKPEFKINASFAGQIKLKILQIIYPLTIGEKMIQDISLDWDFDDNHKVSEHFNRKFKSYSLLEQTEEKVYKEDLCRYIERLLFGISKYCTPKEDYLRIAALHLYLTQGEKAVDKLFQEEVAMKSPKTGQKVITKTATFQKEGKLKFLESLSILKKELTKFNV